jgi:hypothetical protein
VKTQARQRRPPITIAGVALARTVSEVVRLAKRIKNTHGVEPSVSVAPASERSALCIVTIEYDERNPREGEIAARCFRSFAEQVMARGYALYRLMTKTSDGGRGGYVCLLGPARLPRRT